MSETEKAYIVRTTDEDNPFVTVAFAETPSQAKANALLDDGLAYEDYADLRARRIPELDHLVNGKDIVLDWYNTDQLIAAVKAGITCLPEDIDTHTCEACPANQYCKTYANYKEADQ